MLIGATRSCFGDPCRSRPFIKPLATVDLASFAVGSIIVVVRLTIIKLLSLESSDAIRVGYYVTATTNDVALVVSFNSFVNWPNSTNHQQRQKRFSFA